MRALGRCRRQEAIETFPDSPLAVVAKGALAGFAGTLVLTVAVQGAQWVSRHGGDSGRRPEESGAGLGAAQSLAGGQVQPPFLDQSTEIFVQKVATGLFGASLSSTPLAAVGTAMHFFYGGLWGAIYGLLQASLRLPPRLHGVLYGLVVWLIGPVTLVPAMGIMPPVREQGFRRVLIVAGFHVAYGLGLGLAFDAFTRRELRR